MSIRYTLRHNIPSDKLAEEDVNDSSTWDLNLLRKHELAETDNHDIVYRKHDGEVVNWADAATQQANEILEEVQGISSDIDNQVTVVENRLAEIEEEAVTLTEEAQEANEAAQQALVQAESAIESSEQSATDSQNYSNLSRDWAVKTDGIVQGDDYSSKYYAQQAGASATSASSSASTATTAKDTAVSAKEDAQTSATNASNSATLAQRWATKTDGKVDGTDYSAKHYALSCVDSATSAASSASTATTKAQQASSSATSAQTSASSAQNSATQATTKAMEASSSATSASNSASTAATKASEASASASSASTSATNASASETSASASATRAEQAREDIQAYYGVPVGFEFFSMNPNVPDGTLPLLGGEYSREMYASLWEWVQTQTGYLVSESTWAALSNTNNGNVPYYSDGDGSTTFRVPALKCWIKGKDGTETVGTYLDAGLPNITGRTRSVGGDYATGAFRNLAEDYSWGGLSSGTPKAVLSFDASRSSSIYGNSTTVQPESIVGMWLVKAYGAVVDNGSIDVRDYIDEKIEEIDKFRIPLGYEYFTFNPNIPQGSLPLFGGEYLRDTYSDLWNWVQQQTGYLKPEAEWQNLSTAHNGNVPYYSDGDGSTTFRVPSLKCWIKGANGTVSEVGSYLEAGLPNIVGMALFQPAQGGLETVVYADGAFSTVGETKRSVTSATQTGEITISGEQTGYYTDNVSMNASNSNSIYGNSATVQPESIVGMWLVKAYGTVVDTGTIDEQQYIDDRIAAEVTRTDGKFLPLAGGTMTGTLNLQANSSTDNSFTDLMSFDGVTGQGLTYRKNAANNDCLYISMNEGSGWPPSGSQIELWGGTNSDGHIQITASNGTNYKTLSLASTGGIGYSSAFNANASYFRPASNNTITLGDSSYRWKQLFAGTTTISTSDERLKDNISSIPDNVLDAWGDIRWYQFQFKDAIAEKGENARIHNGVIAQRIKSVFKSHGLDAFRYGLLCYDEWDAVPAEYGEHGEIVTPALEAGNQYSIRYEEALCMEAAYQRRRADRLEARIEALERVING